MKRRKNSKHSASAEAPAKVRCVDCRSWKRQGEDTCFKCVSLEAKRAAKAEQQAEAVKKRALRGALPGWHTRTDAFFSLHSDLLLSPAGLQHLWRRNAAAYNATRTRPVPRSDSVSYATSCSLDGDCISQCRPCVLGTRALRLAHLSQLSRRFMQMGHCAWYRVAGSP